MREVFRNELESIADSLVEMAEKATSAMEKSVEALLNDLIRYKTEQTVEFFAQVYGKAPNPDAIRLLMGSQFGYFKQLLDEHMEEERMLACLRALLDFFNAGWRQLCGTLD